MVLSPSQRLVLLDPRATRRVSLTRSGGYIADDNDSSGLLHLPGATWIGPAVTNLFSALVGAKFQWTDTCTRDSTDVPMIGGVSDKIVTGNVVLREGWNATTLTSVSANTTYTVSELVYAPNGATLTIQVDGFTSGDVYVESYNTNFVGTGAVQHVSVTFTTGATVVKLRPLVLTITSTQGITFYVGSGNSGLMGETGAVANPYTATSRSAGRAQMPIAGLATINQGWMASCYRMGWGSAGSSSLQQTAMEIRNGAASLMAQVRWVSGQWNSVVGVTGGLNVTPTGWAAGDYYVLMLKWGAGGATGGLAIDGGAFAGTSAGTITDFTALMDWGNNSAVPTTRAISSDLIWGIVGNGIPTNADSAALKLLFGTASKPKPTIRALDNVARGAHAMAVWDGRGGTFERRIAS